MKQPALLLDTKDDRREIHQLLGQLPPRQRLGFLEWCCSKSAIPNSSLRPKVNPVMRDRMRLALRDDSADEKLTMECFLDIANLAIQYQLDLQLAAKRLERIVSRFRKGGRH